jgi:ABC-type Zn uptake system ZnuABC Zn-binding protein ZnuA
VPNRGFSVGLIVACALTAASCGSSGGSTTAKPDAATDAAIKLNASFVCPPGAGSAVTGLPTVSGRPVQIATTVAPITSIVANVAGDRAVVNGVIPEGEDSHTYEPKPSVAEFFSKADIVFTNGLSLEDPTKELATKNLPAGSRIVELGTTTIKPEQYIYDFSFPRDGGKPNPHLWTNPPMARCYATIAAETLSSIDAANAAYYRANAATFASKIDELDRRFTAASASVPAGNRKLLTYHDAYAYFAAHYGWTVLGAIQVSSFEEPTPKEVATLISQIKREKVPAIFGSEVFPSKVLEQIAKETGTKYVDELRDDDLPGKPGEADHSFLGLMKFDFVTMINSLGGDATNLKSFDASDVAPDKAEYPQ